MENNPEVQETHNIPDDVVQVKKAELDEIMKRAEASSQNFERLKKAEQDKIELTAKLAEKGQSNGFDSDNLKKEIEERVNLRMSGYDPEHIERIEKYAKGAGLSLSEAAKDPFVAKAIEGLRAEKKSLDTTPAPSNRTVLFNGKPVNEVFKTGSEAEKQAAFETRMRGGVKSNE